MKLLKFLQPTRVLEVLRIQLSLGMDIQIRQKLLIGACEMLSNLYPVKVKLEIHYGKNNDIWVFDMPGTHSISFNAECIWVPDPTTKKLIPFHLDYISEVYITTINS